MSIDFRSILGALAQMRQFQDALELVHEEPYSLDDLDKSRKLRDKAFPYSCTDEEGLVLYHVIRAHGLRSGFEIATAFGYSSAFIGLGLAANEGRLVTMDCYVEEWKESFEYEMDELIEAVRVVSERVEEGVLPSGLAMANEQLEALGLADTVTLSVGISPGSVPEALAGAKLDFAMIDGGHFGDQPTADFEAVAPFLAPRCAVFFHDNNQNEAVERAVARAEAELGSGAVVFPTRYNLTLVGRGLDPAAISASRHLLLRAGVG